MKDIMVVRGWEYKILGFLRTLISANIAVSHFKGGMDDGWVEASTKNN